MRHPIYINAYCLHLNMMKNTGNATNFNSLHILAVTTEILSVMTCPFSFLYLGCKTSFRTIAAIPFCPEESVLVAGEIRKVILKYTLFYLSIYIKIFYILFLKVHYQSLISLHTRKVGIYFFQKSANYMHVTYVSLNLNGQFVFNVKMLYLNDAQKIQPIKSPAKPGRSSNTSITINGSI